MHAYLTLYPLFLTLHFTLWHAFCYVPQLPLFNIFNTLIQLLNFHKIMFHVEQSTIMLKDNVSRGTYQELIKVKTKKIVPVFSYNVRNNIVSLHRN